jgi:hypothetical protein
MVFVFCDLLEKGPVLGFIPTTAFDLPSECGMSHAAMASSALSRSNIVSSSFNTTQNLDTEDVILDKAFLTHDDLDSKPELVPDGWKIRTMSKGISWDYWKTRHTVHADDIAAVPQQSVPLPQLWNGGSRGWTR